MIFLGYAMATAMGILLALMGAGGSIMTVPILVYLFKLNPVNATTSSLFIVGCTALLGSVKSVRTEKIDPRVILLFAGPSFVGIFISRYLALPSIPTIVYSIGAMTLTRDSVVLATFAILMILAAVSIFRPADLKSEEPSFKKTIGFGFAVGLVTGFVGAGGGFLIVPALVRLLKVPLRTAVGTSLLIVAANSFFGFTVSYLTDANVDFKLILTILLFAVFGLLIGFQLSNRIEEPLLKRAFGVLVLIAGSAILIEQLFVLF